MLAAAAIACSTTNGPASRLLVHNRCELRSAVLALHAEGREAIPALIEAIGDKTPVPVSLSDPRRSYVKAAEESTPRGVIAAYVVELILARTEMNTASSPDCDFVLEPQDFLYQQGRIYDAELREVTDLVPVQQRYRTWWQSNSGLSLDALREAWSQGHRPLAQSPLQWR
jgi:hypothetical protein